MNDQSLGDNPTHDYIEWGKLTGCSSAWLERYVRDVEVAGSNPVIPILSPYPKMVCDKRNLDGKLGRFVGLVGVMPGAFQQEKIESL